MMTIEEAQAESRQIYLNGSVGQLVSAILWLTSAALGTWHSARAAILVLIFGGMLIFPLTQLALRLSGRPASLGAGNPLRYLAMQVAFIVPLTLPVAGGAALHNLNWLYPSCAVLVGAHYLPFVFLYGMWEYAVLSGVLVGGGLVIAMYLRNSFTLAGWFTGIALAAFAAWAAATSRARVGSRENG